MIVYYVTFFSVILFLTLAESQDHIGLVLNENGAVQHTSNSAICYFIASCILIFVAGLRYKVGTDYSAYYKHYDEYINHLTSSLIRIDEPGFGLISWIATRFYNDGASVIFLASLITISISLIVIYRNTDKLLMAGFLYLVLCWIGSFNGIRQYLAAAVLFCGYRSLKDRKFLNYLLAVFIAFLFHRSAIVMAFLFFVVYLKLNWASVLLLITLTGIILFSYDRVFAFAGWVMEANYYVEEEYTFREVNRLRVIAACIPAITFIYMYRDKEMTDAESFFLNLTIVHAALRIFTMNSALLYRIGIYTSLFQTIAIPELLKGIKEYNKKVITAGIVFMNIGMWWYEIYKSFDLSHFRWIWQR